MTVKKYAIDQTTLDLQESSLAWMTAIQPYLRTNRIVHLTIPTIQVVRSVTYAQDLLRLNRLTPSRVRNTVPRTPDLAGGGDSTYGPIVFTTPEI